jgi:hypothetical protein
LEKRLAEFVRTQIESTLCPTYFGYDLACSCAVSSWTLWRFLTKNQIKSNFVLGRWYGDVAIQVEECLYEDIPVDWESVGIGHCWIEIDDKIIDITLTQFDNVPNVCILDEDDDDFYHYPLKRNQDAINEINCCWPKEQNPKTYYQYLKGILK